MQDVFIARQPIFDAELRVFGYELLCRPAGRSPGPGHDGDAATSEVILNAFTLFGLDELVNERLAFINLTRAFLVARQPVPFPPDRVVLEVLEGTEPDAELLEGLARLRAAGYRIALDDFIYAPELEPLLHHADLVKVEITRLTPRQMTEHAARLAPHGVGLIAEKVETRAVFEHCRRIGFQYFQGFFLECPTVVRGSSLPTSRLQALSLLANLQSPDADADRLTRLISNDASLSYKLLRYLNSPLARPRSPIDSIHRAVVYLGLKELRIWASLIALASVPGKPRELWTLFMVRARLAEQLAVARGDPDPSAHFTVGLLSGLDAMLEAPLEELVSKLPLSEAVEGALLRREGDLGRLLQAVIDFQRGDPSRLAALGLHAAQVNRAHAEAIQWAEALASLWSEPPKRA